MDLEERSLRLIGKLSQAWLSSLEDTGPPLTKTFWSRDLDFALKDADFVLLTFRIGGMEARIRDEKTALKAGIIGQETTGAGGFSMALRSLPVLADLINRMTKLCPEAWLINFSNPSGIMTQAAISAFHWEKTLGICDAPYTMHSLIAALLDRERTEVQPGYFGLNHLGWIDSIKTGGSDLFYPLLSLLKGTNRLPGYPFPLDFIRTLGLIPNEYLYYYYYQRLVLKNLLSKKETRGEFLRASNLSFLENLEKASIQSDIESMVRLYNDYLKSRQETYFSRGEEDLAGGQKSEKDNFQEEGFPPFLKDRITKALINEEGYAGVAAEVLESLSGAFPREIIINTPNRGAIPGIEPEAVVEIPARLDKNRVDPVSRGNIPKHCLGLMRTVKAYEDLTIYAAVNRSYREALLALTIHPLVGDATLAGKLVKEYREQHGSLFPELR